MQQSVNIVGYLACVCILALCTGRAIGQQLPRQPESRSARQWTLPDASRINAKTVAENNDVVLLECNRSYSRFTGQVLLRVSQLEESDRQFVKKLRQSVPRPSDGALPGDDAKTTGPQLEIEISLTQICLAILCYLQQHRTFPERAIYSQDGTPLLSWRVRILPYLGESKLYEEFRRNEPWDSEHNRKLVERIPLAYAAGIAKVADGKTRYLAPIGDGTLWEGRGGREIRRISDGTAYTIAVVHAAADPAVPWTMPDDLELDARDVREGLAERDLNGFCVGFADGHSALMPIELDGATLRGYLTVAGRERVPRVGHLLPRFPRRTP